MKLRLFSALFAIWFLFLGIIFSLQIAISTYILQKQSHQNIHADIVKIASHIQKDFVYKNNSWNMSLFNADPLTPYPNSSGSYPLYIMTLDGFVISRTNVISGLLDTTDQNSFLHFSTPQTIHTVTNETWRLLSKKVQQSNNISTLILVAYFQPQPELLSSIDTKLADNVSRISQMIAIRNNRLDLSQLDIRKLDYDISFEIIDQSNTILASNGRAPTYIDPSYIYRQLRENKEKTFQDAKTGESFLLYTTSLIDNNNQQRGIIVVGKSVQSNIDLIKEYISAISKFILILLFPITALAFITTLTLARALHVHQDDILKDANKILFDEKSAVLTIGNASYPLDATSIQYMLCKILFSNPTEIFAQEDLIEKFNFTSVSKDYKKIYDAMLGMNKKIGSQLIIYKDKKYFINPLIASKIK